MEVIPAWKIKYKPVFYQIVCWHCRRAHVTLYNVKDEEGKKTNDYVCVNCREKFPRPEIYNCSRVLLKVEEKEEGKDKKKTKNVLEPGKFVYG